MNGFNSDSIEVKIFFLRKPVISKKLQDCHTYAERIINQIIIFSPSW